MATKKRNVKSAPKRAGRHQTARQEPVRPSLSQVLLLAEDVAKGNFKRGELQAFITEVLRPDAHFFSDDVLKIIVDKIMGFSPLEQLEGRLSASLTGKALSENRVAVMQIAMEHRDAIVPSANHWLAPHLWLNSYWRERVMKEIEGRDWWKAWGELLLAVKGFVVPRKVEPTTEDDSESTTDETKLTMDGETQFHHPANPDTLRELVRALYNALVAAGEITPVSVSDRIPPPRKRMRVVMRRDYATVVPSTDEDPPWWGLVVRIGGTTKKYCSSYRHQFEELGEVPAMACCLGLYFDPPPSFGARAASPSRAERPSPSSGRSRPRYVTRSK
jgi:hypothetical protein